MLKEYRIYDIDLGMEDKKDDTFIWNYSCGNQQ